MEQDYVMVTIASTSSYCIPYFFKSAHSCCKEYLAGERNYISRHDGNPIPTRLFFDPGIDNISGIADWLDRIHFNHPVYLALFWVKYRNTFFSKQDLLDGLAWRFASTSVDYISLCPVACKATQQRNTVSCFLSVRDLFCNIIRREPQIENDPDPACQLNVWTGNDDKTHCHFSRNTCVCFLDCF